ncbi:bipartite regulator domain [Escherichia coli]|nr:bipartite regulator domain [Escherichia coli]
MGYMVSGYNPYQIAEVLDMDIRSIYAYKQRIEKRMGGKTNELFIRSHSVQH